MKKLLILIIILLFPITVFAKTLTKEETLEVIKKISNVTVVDGVTINSTEVDDENIIFSIGSQEIYIPYSFEENKMSFKGGSLLLDSNNKVIGDLFDNEYAFFLYSILENKSNIPYDANTYYNSETIKNIVDNNFETEYKESTNTFGFTLSEDEYESGKYNITYNYFMDGDYPVMDFGDGEDQGNPATGNYNVLVTIMLISVLCLGIYSYVNRGKKKKA